MMCEYYYSIQITAWNNGSLFNVEYLSYNELLSVPTLYAQMRLTWRKEQTDWTNFSVS